MRYFETTSSNMSDLRFIPSVMSAQDDLSIESDLKTISFKYKRLQDFSSMSDLKTVPSIMSDFKTIPIKHERFQDQHSFMNDLKTTPSNMSDQDDSYNMSGLKMIPSLEATSRPFLQS